ncbi:MAG TPA: hypothetical protein VJ953_17145 [Saprospiraceae bacterium]|nr:hypothetical protein [Saprospiraceae bacterium]
MIYKKIGIILLIVYLAAGCEKENVELGVEQFFVEHQQKKYAITSSSQLNDFVTEILNKQNISVSKAAFKRATDEYGEFYGILAEYDEQGKRVSVSLQLKKLQSSENFLSFTLGCTMTCTPMNGCNGCKQVIVRECVAQSCSCTSGIGGCESEITVPDPEQ